MRFRFVLAVTWLAVVSGCGGHAAELRREVDSLKARVAELDRTDTAQRQRLAGMEDRVLLLQDQVDTQRLAASRVGTPPLSVVAAVPAPPSAPAASTSGAVTIRTPGPASLPVVRVSPTASDTEAAEASDDDSYGEESQSPRSPRESREIATPDGMGDVYVTLDDEGRVVGGREAGRSPGKVQRAASIRPAGRDASRLPDPSEDAAPLAAYRTAYEAYQQGRVDESLPAFRAFAKAYPRHPYADNAQYWVGECFYDRRDWENARREFMRVVTEHPDGNKVPDAMVKVGLCDQRMQQSDDARRMYDAVMLTFPDSPAAAVAMRLLGEMP